MMATYEDLIKQGYKQSDTVTNYQTKLNEAMANKPAAYSSQYSSQLGDMYSQITNRKPFSYDLGSDALYQQYANQYKALGQQAMQDTMGQAASLTGGYGSTYSQRAGQQAYNSYLSQLNDKVPELAQLARSNYDADTQALYDQYNLTKSADDTDYSRYRDTVSDWQSDVNLYNSLFNNERSFDYQQWGDNISNLMALAKMNSGGSGSGGGYSTDSGTTYTLPDGSRYTAGTIAANRPTEGSQLSDGQKEQIWRAVDNMASIGMSYNERKDAINSGGGYFSSTEARKEALRYLNGR